VQHFVVALELAKIVTNFSVVVALELGTEKHGDAGVSMIVSGDLRFLVNRWAGRTASR
jgi:hypothetical protein